MEYNLEINYKQNKHTKKSMRNIFCFFLVVLISLTITSESVFAQTEKDPEIMFNLAKEYFVNGEYKQARKRPRPTYIDTLNPGTLI